MAAQTLVEATGKSLRIAYQPFLSSTRTRQLTSLLQSSLPYTFLPAHDTSLSLPENAQIVLLSRGGKPFAPVERKSSIDSKVNRSFRQKDWEESSVQYQKYLDRWTQIQSQLPYLVTELQKYFTNEVIKTEAFKERFQVLKSTLPDPEPLRDTIRKYQELRRSQLFLFPILKNTQAPLKLAAQSHFGYSTLESRERVLEQNREKLDVFRYDLERRFKGMALVKTSEVMEPKPWILMPENPVDAWGVTLPDRTDELIRLALYRFLLSEEEKEVELERESRELVHESLPGLRRMQGKVDIEETVTQVKEQLREEKARMFEIDSHPLTLPDTIGELGEFKDPITKEDIAVYETSDRQLAESGAWRVAD